MFSPLYTQFWMLMHHRGVNINETVYMVFYNLLAHVSPQQLGILAMVYFCRHYIADVYPSAQVRASLVVSLLQHFNWQYLSIIDDEQIYG